MSDVLSLHEIANWQLAPEMGEVRAALPALQRGFVWNVQQVEELWDSIIRQFPIGAFLLSPFDEKQGSQRFKYEQLDAVTSKPTHHLLDGQQRSTAIALGFMDVWSDNIDSGSALWVDIGEAPKKRDVEFVFRVLTRSHPWGYSSDDPTKTLEAKERRNALSAYQQATPTYKDLRASQIPLSVVWPWKSSAPIPFALVVAAINESLNLEQSKDLLANKLESLDFFKSSDKYKNLVQAFNGDNKELSDRLDRLLRNSWLIFQEKKYFIPILSLSLKRLSMETVATDLVKDDEVEPAPDAIETLFLRINRNGTPIDGEELAYSLLKSSWPDAPDFISKLQHKLTSPSQIAMFCARLILARRDESGKSGFPKSISVAVFRRNMRKQAFREGLRDFIQKDAVRIFEYAHEILTKAEYALPAVLATDIAQKSPDVFFLLLCWIDRMIQEKIDLHVANEQHREVLGFLTSIAWFSGDKKHKEKIVSNIWNKLQQTSETHEIKSFFSAKSFKGITIDQFYLMPLLPPDILKRVLLDEITLAGIENLSGINEENGRVWSEGDYWSYLVTSMPDLLSSWYDSVFNDEQEEQSLESYKKAWGRFFVKVGWNKSMLLYAQREWINQWFPDFDPSLPDSLKDLNCPWDYDHIHPQNYIKNVQNERNLRNIPQIIRIWHGSIGNLRAWPMELNRSDSDKSPISKLTKVAEREACYGIDSSGRLRDASLISEDDFSHWKSAMPESNVGHNYLAYPHSHSHRTALLKGIIIRFVAIYSEWYQSLRIGDLTR